jgi:hypothetical protein
MPFGRLVRVAAGGLLGFLLDVLMQLPAGLDRIEPLWHPRPLRRELSEPAFTMVRTRRPAARRPVRVTSPATGDSPATGGNPPFGLPV